LGSTAPRTIADHGTVPGGCGAFPVPANGIRTALPFSTSRMRYTLACGALVCSDALGISSGPQYGHQPVDEHTPVIVAQYDGGGFCTQISQ